MRKSPYQINYRRFLIIGLGMMGTSLAAAIRKAYRNPTIDGIVKDEEERVFLQKQGIFSHIYLSEQWFPSAHPSEESENVAAQKQDGKTAEIIGTTETKEITSTGTRKSLLINSTCHPDTNFIQLTQLPARSQYANMNSTPSGKSSASQRRGKKSQKSAESNKWNLYDLVIFAVPISIELLYLAKIPSHIGNIPTKVLITSLSSCYELIFRVLPKGLNYIGSHPICGNEKSGPQHYQEDLFANQLCFLIPSRKAGLRVQKFLLQKFWRKLKMHVTSASAAQHDEVLALISHLPHLIAGTLAKWAWGQGPFQRVQQTLNSRLKKLFRGNVGLAGGGFRDLIRISGSNPEMWANITLANRKRIVVQLQKFIRRLTLLEEQLNFSESENIRFWRKWFQEARVSRDNIWGKKK